MAAMVGYEVRFHDPPVDIRGTLSFAGTGIILEKADWLSL